MKSIGILVVLLFLVFAQGNVANAQNKPRSPGSKEILFNTKVERDDAEIVAAAPPAPHSGYATVRYSIGTPQQKPRLRELITTIAMSLPASLGNSEGTYTVTLTLTDLDGNLLVKEPVLSFQWTRQRGFLFIDTVVTDARKTSWSGILINQMPITENNQNLKLSVEVFAQTGRSLDFDLLKKTGKSFSDGALAALFPMPAAALPIITSMTDLIASLYANSTKRNLVDQGDLTMEATKTPIRAPIRFANFESISVLITVTTKPSRLAADIFADGKFKSNPDDFIFNDASMTVGGGKSVSIVELISTSTDARLKSTRAMLDAVLVPGGTYGKDDKNKKEENIGILCGNLYDALNRYLSKYDARAMFWAFINRYGENLNKSACIGSRQGPLAEVGLSLQ
jgi:hypothetical protein